MTNRVASQTLVIEKKNLQFRNNIKNN